MAAPHVSGAVAVLASARAATAYEVWSALISTGPSITDPNSGVTRHRLDIPAALSAFLGATGPLPTPVIIPTRGVSASTEVISPPSALDAGDRFGDSFVIRNVGSVAATYRLVVGEAGPVLGVGAAAWVLVEPVSITLVPDDLGLIGVEVRVPSDAAPGDYEVLITPVDDTAADSDGARPVLVRFSVRPPAGDGGGSPGGGGGSSDDDLDSAGRGARPRRHRIDRRARPSPALPAAPAPDLNRDQFPEPESRPRRNVAAVGRCWRGNPRRGRDHDVGGAAVRPGDVPGDGRSVGPAAEAEPLVRRCSRCTATRWWRSSRSSCLAPRSTRILLVRPARPRLAAGRRDGHPHRARRRAVERDRDRACSRARGGDSGRRQ